MGKLAGKVGRCCHLSKVFPSPPFNRQGNPLLGRRNKAGIIAISSCFSNPVHEFPSGRGGEKNSSKGLQKWRSDHEDLSSIFIVPQEIALLAWEHLHQATEISLDLEDQRFVSACCRRSLLLKEGELPVFLLQA